MTSDRNLLAGLLALQQQYRANGEYARAAKLFNEALAIQKGDFPADLVLHLGLLNNVGMAYLDGGELKKAEEFFAGTKELFEKQHGATHPITMIFVNNLALARHVAKRYDESIPVFEEMLESKKNSLPPKHPSLLNALSNLGNALDDVDRSQEAQSYHLQTLTLRRELASGKQTKDVAVALAMLARNQLLLKQFQIAESHCREAIPIMEELAPNHWRLFDARSMLGGALLGQKRFEEAETILVDSYTELKKRSHKIPSSTASRLPEAVKRLVTLYEALNKPDEVKKWKEELQKLTPENG